VPLINKVVSPANRGNKGLVEVIGGDDRPFTESTPNKHAWEAGRAGWYL
jgi:hypothetical protein